MRQSFRIIALCLILISSSQAISQEVDSYVHYVTQQGLFRLNIASFEFEQLHTSDPGITLYSIAYDGQSVVFWDDHTVWFSELNHWSPRTIFSDDRDRYPERAFDWLPDDSHFIFTLSSIPTYQGEIPDDVQTFIYDPQTDVIEEWGWEDCNRLVRNLETQQLGLVCERNSWLDEDIPSEIIFYWGGESESIAENNYEVLLDQARTGATFWFSWQNEGQTLVFVDRNPEFDPINNHSVPVQLLYLYRDSSISEILPAYAHPPHNLTISDEYGLIAYTVDCTYNQLRICLQIDNMSTHTTLFADREVILFGNVVSMLWRGQKLLAIGDGLEIGTYQIVIIDSVSEEVIQLEIEGRPSSIR